MNIKSLSVAVSALVLSTSVNAAFIDNITYTTDVASGLDWLDFDYTSGVTYNDAVTATSLVEGGGWRYATNTEVVDLFGHIFPNWTATDSYGRSTGTFILEVEWFAATFGKSDITNPNPYWNESRVMYEDEDGILRMAGVGDYITDDQYDTIYGVDSLGIYNRETAYASNSTYLVRDASVVPVPATVWLFGSGLIGLIGMARRKKA